MLKDESELADIGIYVFSYRTDINTGSYSLSDIVDSLREYFLLDGLIDSLGIVFVCHSMGGIVARRFLVKEQSLLLSRGLNTISLFLVASPSLGSEYANMLSLVSRAIGHTQASALQFSQNNVWLNDLDKDFMNFKANERLRIKGKELIEDLPLYGKGYIRKQIVEPFSGARYFGNSFKVPGSDHSTIATPASKDAVQSRLLVQFVKEFLDEITSASKLPHPIEKEKDIVSNGILIQEVGDAAIYLIDEGKRRHIEELATFNEVFKDIPNIHSILEKNDIPEGNPIISGSVLVTAIDSDPVYLIDKYDGSNKKWKKRHIQSLAIFHKYQFNQNHIQVVPQAILDGMDDGAHIL